MAGPCTLDSVQLLCGSDDYSHGIFLNARVYACHTTATELDSAYETNYAGNKPTEAMARDTLLLRWKNGDWQAFSFGSPFVYNGSDNLILEFRWQGDNDSAVYDLGWYTPGNRALDARSSTAEIGTPRDYMPRFRIFYSTIGIVEGVVTYPAHGQPVTATPNPFRASVTLHAPGNGPLEASVYSSAGTLVRRIARANSSTTLCWDGRDEYGRQALPGAYVCRLLIGSRVQMVRLVLHR
jgi:hypothetical protein